MIEIVDIARKEKKRHFRGLNPALAPSRKWMAWQTAVDYIARPVLPTHVMLSDTDGNNQIDLGEGAAPVFLRDDATLLFVRADHSTERLDVIRYNIATGQREIQPTNGGDSFHAVYDFGISPNGTTMMLATGSGPRGGLEYWRTSSPGFQWTFFEGLESSGGWSKNGWLVYATNGSELRALDAKHNVSVSDIKLSNQVTGEIRTAVSGVSMNQEPRWCRDVPN